MSLIKTLVVIGILVACVYLITQNMNNDDSSEKFSEEQFQFQPTLDNFDGIEHMTSEQPVIQEPTQEPTQGPTQGHAQGHTQSKNVDTCCDYDTTLNSKDLLPNNVSNDWDSYCKGSASQQIDPTDFLLDPIMVQTLGPTLRNANLQIRSEPPNPQMKVSPWLQSTINPEQFRRPLDIG